MRRYFTSLLVTCCVIQTIGSSESLANPPEESPLTASFPTSVCAEKHVQFHLLGSSNGRLVPRPFCSCHACQQARKKGGKNYRTRTSMNVYLPGQGPHNAKYKIDLPPDTGYHVIKYRIDDTQLEHLLITHDHPDHCDPSFLAWRRTAISGTEEMRPLHVYSGSAVEQLIRQQVKLSACKVVFHRFEPFQWVHLGPLSVYSLRANHSGSSCLNFVVQAEGTTVLLAWDTGKWSEETWQAVRQFRFDAVFMECTAAGPQGRDAGPGHLNATTFLEMKQRLTRLELVKPQAPFIAVHLGDNSRLDHEQMEEYWTPHGVTVGYDGLLVDLERPLEKETGNQ